MAPGVASLINPGLDAAIGPSYAREPEHLVPARVLLAHGRPEQAGELLERLQGLAVAQQRAGSRIEVHALQALALAASGEEASAVTALAQAVALARAEGYVRLFADEGAPWPPCSAA
jgi:LuxR family maltose regulon positive regulatory protein